MEPQVEVVRWRDLEAQSDRPEVQQRIRREIRKGRIRVRPRPDGGIRIIPVQRPGTD
jgi:hypothetical protein